MVCIYCMTIKFDLQCSKTGKKHNTVSDAFDISMGEGSGGTGPWYPVERCCKKTSEKLVLELF